MKRRKPWTTLGTLSLLALGQGCAEPSPEALGREELHWDTESATDPAQSTHLWIVEHGLMLLDHHLADGDPGQKAVVRELLRNGADGAPAVCGRAWRQGLLDADFLHEYNNGSRDTHPGDSAWSLFWSGATWKSHFFDPTTQRNYWGDLSPTAYTQAVDFYGRSVNAVNTDAALSQDACYKLGLALHYFTDLSQPMHAANYPANYQPLMFHSHYEGWVMETIQPTVSDFGTWRDPGTRSVEQLAVDLATFSNGLWPMIWQAHDDAVNGHGWKECIQQHIAMRFFNNWDDPSCWNTSGPLTAVTKTALTNGIEYSAMWLSRWAQAVAPAIGPGPCTSIALAKTSTDAIAPAPCPVDTVTSCSDIARRDPSSADGEYDITIGLKTLRVYCHDMQGTPREYLTLPRSHANGQDVNYSYYGAGPNTAPGGLKTWYTKLRFLPDDMVVDVTDRTFAVSDGGWISFGPSFFYELDYAGAGDCAADRSQTGHANIDLIGLPLQVSPGQFLVEGWQPAGTDSYASDNQVANLHGGGYCGVMRTENGRLELSWLDPVLDGHAKVALYVPEGWWSDRRDQWTSVGLTASQGVVIGRFDDVAFWDVTPVSQDDPNRGYYLAMNGQYISSAVTHLPNSGDALLLTGDRKKAAAFVPVSTGDGHFFLRLAGSDQVLTLDTRGTLGRIEPLQPANGVPYFQYFTTDGTLPVAPAAVTLYTHPYFGGPSQVLEPGYYDINVFYDGMGNDTLSSLRIPEGMSVTLFEHAGFDGETRILSGDVVGLADFDNLASSVIVEHVAPTSDLPEGIPAH